MPHPELPSPGPGSGESPAVQDRRRQLMGELFRFGAIGAANAVLDLGLFNLLYLLLDTPALLAKTAASAVATLSSYLCNRRWTFRGGVQRPHRSALAAFLGVNAAGFLVSLLPLAALGLLRDEPDLLALNLAGVAGVGLGAVVRFTGYRQLVFQTSRRAPLRHTD